MHACRKGYNGTRRWLRSVRIVLTGGDDAYSSGVSLGRIGRDGSKNGKTRGEKSVGVAHAVGQDWTA